jgi:hypothetical protein
MALSIRLRARSETVTDAVGCRVREAPHSTTPGPQGPGRIAIVW